MALSLQTSFSLCPNWPAIRCSSASSPSSTPTRTMKSSSRFCFFCFSLFFEKKKKKNWKEISLTVVIAQEFIGALSTFSEKGNTEAKLKFAFQIYDMDGDGYISNGELFQVLKMMVGDNLNEVQLQQIVDKTILEADVDRDGKISYEEFRQMISHTEEIDSKMTVNLN